MLGRNTGLFISCALGASAFLIPAGVSISNSKDAALPFVDLDPKHQTIQLPCPTCTDDIFEQSGTESRGSGEDYDLLVQLAISDDDQTLLLNDRPIYPHDAFMLAYDGGSIQQIPASTTRQEIADNDFVGVPLTISASGLDTGAAKEVTPFGDEVISLTWQLLGVSKADVKVDPILIQLLRTSEGELLILAADIAPELAFDVVPMSLPVPHFGLPSPAHIEPPKNCKHMPAVLCDMVSAIESKVDSLQTGRPRPGCSGKGGRLPTHIRPGFGAADGKHGNHGPHQGSHHGPHHGHHRHSFLQIVLKHVTIVLLTAMVTIIVGMVVSILGLLTGHFIGYLWFTVIRGRKRGYARVASDDIIITVTDVDEKDGSIEEVDQLPRYEDAPAYEETEKEVQ